MQLPITVFPYVIGYHGEIAIVDKKLKSRCQNKPYHTLVAEGQIKVAFCQALFQGESALQEVTDLFNKMANTQYNLEGMKRLLGVFEITQAKKIRYI
ncbi:hypothetical protein PVA45_00510 [Entomospira entomophila]|uniref:Uncharacterized protein n=1 Tax=Entomospira entomophila TaxID=2719988 RepID=A0A968KQS5_9SPIO|nr:hypothetical protein [Entomospira entomophilus]NIZ40003.1 hypothetical protein [Entomospira entomophilus]WDI35563.1 hypothetical protein PVA45_00510 [Entomospira entomophilus]